MSFSLLQLISFPIGGEEIPFSCQNVALTSLSVQSDAAQDSIRSLSLFPIVESTCEVFSDQLNLGIEAPIEVLFSSQSFQVDIPDDIRVLFDCDDVKITNLESGVQQNFLTGIACSSIKDIAGGSINDVIDDTIGPQIDEFIKELDLLAGDPVFPQTLKENVLSIEGSLAPKNLRILSTNDIVRVAKNFFNKILEIDVLEPVKQQISQFHQLLDNFVEQIKGKSVTDLLKMFELDGTGSSVEGEENENLSLLINELLFIAGITNDEIFDFFDDKLENLTLSDIQNPKDVVALLTESLIVILPSIIEDNEVLQTIQDLNTENADFDIDSFLNLTLEDFSRNMSIELPPAIGNIELNITLLQFGSKLADEVTTFFNLLQQEIAQFDGFLSIQFDQPLGEFYGGILSVMSFFLEPIANLLTQKPSKSVTLSEILRDFGLSPILLPEENPLVSISFKSIEVGSKFEVMKSEESGATITLPTLKIPEGKFEVVLNVGAPDGGETTEVALKVSVKAALGAALSVLGNVDGLQDIGFFNIENDEDVALIGPQIGKCAASLIGLAVTLAPSFDINYEFIMGNKADEGLQNLLNFLLEDVFHNIVPNMVINAINSFEVIFLGVDAIFIEDECSVNSIRLRNEANGDDSSDTFPVGFLALGASLILFIILGTIFLIKGKSQKEDDSEKKNPEIKENII